MCIRDRDIGGGAQRDRRRGVPPRAPGRDRGGRGGASRRDAGLSVTEPAYALGVDFGTESGRALLLDLRTGEEAAVSEVAYAHGVIDRELPQGGDRSEIGQLPPDWALQHSDDWLAVLDLSLIHISNGSPAEPSFSSARPEGGVCSRSPDRSGRAGFAFMCRGYTQRTIRRPPWIR